MKDCKSFELMGLSHFWRKSLHFCGKYDTEMVSMEEDYVEPKRIWRPWNGKVRKKARKREKCTKSTQETLGVREIPNLAPPDSTELKIRVELSVWRRQTSSLAIARWPLDVFL
ncbi:hypothetical protein OSB04_012377 [Centaurea solstitialis]|uniref:Uncharacterized protein n=1 Tax=Centaurea solstitialis TaxID=347529 RepID=A0AA38TIT6_9ASTR|nr:hypothetical protein OSB04_012377 [Centaurea solstitialis]